MASTFSDTDMLTDAIEAALTLPPSQVGTRLRPEIQLAKKLNLGRAAVRVSLNKLVRKGILVRRQGSGTFVRRLPMMVSTGWEADNPHPVTPDVLFATDEDIPVEKPHRVKAVEKRLHFSVWSDLSRRSSQLIVAGIVQEANRLGHHVSMHSLIGMDKSPESLAKLAERLRNDPCDGYLILEPWADLIEAALGKIDRPAVYFWWLSCPDSKRFPLVSMDVFAFFYEAAHRLKQQGYRRIAAINLKTEPEPSMATSASMYRAAISACGLEYALVDQAALGIPGSFGINAHDVTTKMLQLTGDKAPDAIIVGDDYLVDAVARTLCENGKRIGHDFGLVSYANKGMPVGDGQEFSVMESDLEAYGGIVLDMLERCTSKAGPILPTISIAPRWKPGKTHLRDSQ